MVIPDSCFVEKPNLCLFDLMFLPPTLWLLLFTFIFCFGDYCHQVKVSKNPDKLLAFFWCNQWRESLESYWQMLNKYNQMLKSEKKVHPSKSTWSCVFLLNFLYDKWSNSLKWVQKEIFLYCLLSNSGMISLWYKYFQ